MDFFQARLHAVKLAALRTSPLLGGEPNDLLVACPTCGMVFFADWSTSIVPNARATDAAAVRWQLDASKRAARSRLSLQCPDHDHRFGCGI